MGELDHVPFRGEPVTRRQRAAILWTEEDKEVPFLFVVPQGSWQPVTSYSGTTHHGAGAMDLWFDGIGDNDKSREVLRQLRGRGSQASFLRGPPQALGGFSMWHFHTLDLDTRGMDSNAKWQVAEYKNGNNGLDGGVNDPNPWRPNELRPFNFDAWRNLVEKQHKIHLLTDRIEDHQETIDDIRKERDQLKKMIKRQLVQKI
jgi:hypothetical protein